MLFSEIYSAYYNAVAEILKKAVEGTLTEKELYKTVMNEAFAESITTIPESLKKGVWPFLNDDFSTPIENVPTMPLTLLQKRWLKSLLSDRRIKLFSPDISGLDDIEPLYSEDDFVYFDRYADADNYDDEKYIEHFKTVLKAIKEKRKLRIKFNSRTGQRQSRVCIPEKLEYSPKDDKFRVITNTYTVNMARVNACEPLDKYDEKTYKPSTPKKKELVLELVDERKALERAMLHFSPLEKETQKLGEKHYRITLKYYTDDETELVIRVLSFGPMLKVVAPESFKEQIKTRIEKQIKLRT